MNATWPVPLIGCCLLLVFAGGTHDALAATRQDLVAHGSADRFWIARILPGDADTSPVKTQVYVRSVGESRWLPVLRDPVESRVVAMAHRGTQLALLLEDGDWLLVSEDALATGRPLPAGGTILDLASSADTLLALGRLRVPGAPVATSSNETYRLALFSLAPSGWVEVGDLGAAPAAARGDAALAVVDSTVHVALRDAERPGRVRVLRQTPQQTWADAAAVDVGDDATAVKLLGGGPVPVVWALKPTGGYSLHWVGPQWVRSESLSPPAKVRASEVAAALAIERVRVVHYNTDGQLLERTFEPLPASLAEAPGASPATVPASRPAAQVTRIVLPGRSIGPLLTRYVQPLLTVALLFTVVASLSRHRQMQEAMAGAQKLPLAPPGRRLVAGLIDALPLLAAMGSIAMGGRELEDVVDDRAVWTVVAAGAALYFLHTTVSEVLLGRTVGKMICGLRVVALDGQRPTRAALVTRNVLRIIDVLIGFFPLVLVLYSPLRQRAGDVAAGTLVVLSRQPGDTEEAEADEEKREPLDVTK